MTRLVRIPGHYLQWRFTCTVDGACMVWQDHETTGRAYAQPAADACPPDGHLTYGKKILAVVNHARASVPYRGGQRMAAVTVEQASDERYYPFEFWVVTARPPTTDFRNTPNHSVQLPDGTVYRHHRSITPTGRYQYGGWYATRETALAKLRDLAALEPATDGQAMVALYPSGSWSMHRGLDIVPLGVQEEG